MTDADIAHFYNLPSAYPEEWPAELDEEDELEEEALERRSSRASKSGYLVLDRSNSRRGVNIGSLKGKNGRDNLVKVDEADPLGSNDSVLKNLKRRGLPVDDDTRLRNRFLLSSTSFSPALFLSQVHPDASIQSLLDGLSFLSQSIDQKSASLKVLVEANFERFVRAKATIDSVYTEMRNQGKEQELTRQQQAHRRSVGHLRGLSGAKQSISHAPGTDTGPRKNALLKESDYGLKGIRVPLMEASVKAEEVWGPALGGREREQVLKSVVDSMERHRELYEIGGLLSKSIKQRDYESVFEQYSKARALTQNAKNLADIAASKHQPLSDEETHLMLAMGRMWLDVDQQIQTFKRDLWRRLSEAPTTSTRATASGPVEEHMELIGALLELGVEDNPIWVWLLSRYDFLRTKITAFCERCKVEIEILRRRLASGEKPSPQEVAAFLRQAPQDTSAGTATALDTDQVIELWECVHTYLNKLLSSQGGLLGEVLDFWEVAQSFIDGSKQKLLPTGFEGESRKHHKFSSSDTRDLQKGVVELVNLIRESVLALFSDLPVDDVSLLTSPISPSTPTSPSLGVTPTESRFKLDPKNMPFPTPKHGELWEEYAFWPPFSNSLSGVHYLGQFLVIIGAAAGEMAALEPVSGSTNAPDLLKTLVSIVRERSVRIACSAWGKDAEVCKLLEDWTRDPKRRDLTKMPGLFVNFQNAMLGGMQKILYISEAMAKPGAVAVVTQPPTKLLQMVRREFVSSVDKALSGLVENAQHPSVPKEDDEWSLPGPKGIRKKADISPSILAADAVDSGNRNVRILLTLSNIKALQSDFVPLLITNFETSFSVKLTDETKALRHVLDQIDQRLFQSYTQPTVSKLNKIIAEGIASADWEPSANRPNQVRPYVYDTMLTLVLVHTEISTTIPPISSTVASRSSSANQSPLLSIVLTHLLTQISSSLLSSFNSRPSYTLSALIQATLDTEFIAQTMSQFSSNEASGVQSQIYVELDRRTTHEARARLQSELGEMRGILKRLRERTKGEFACFKKPRSGTSQKQAS